MRERPRIYDVDPDRAPDEDFEPGDLAYAVVGNEGRMLDSRRTPISVVGVRTDIGHVVLEVTGFEDAGARWDSELESLDRFQFAEGSARVESVALTELEEVVRRLDRHVEIGVDADARERTARRLPAEQRGSGCRATASRCTPRAEGATRRRGSSSQDPSTSAGSWRWSTSSRSATSPIRVRASS